MFLEIEGLGAHLTRLANENQWCILLIGLLFCHYLADFCLTTKWMIRAKADASHYMPILAHAAVHAVLMVIVLFTFGVPAGGCLMGFIIQLFSHYIIDASKALLTRHVEVLRDNTRKPYWMVYGFDQMLHILVIVGMTVCFC